MYVRKLHFIKYAEGYYSHCSEPSREYTSEIRNVTCVACLKRILKEQQERLDQFERIGNTNFFGISSTEKT